MPFGRPLSLALILAGSLGLGESPAGGASAVGSPGAAPEPRLNVVFLLADDQRFDALGAAGNPIVRTPHLDRLTRQGVRFSRAFCTTSICPTSRASFLTGQHAARHGIVDFDSGLSDAQFAASWVGVLQSLGYRSAFVGKWGLGGELPSARFDFFRGFAGQGRYFLAGRQRRTVDEGGTPAYSDPAREGHLTAHLGDLAVELLSSPELREPFLLQLSFKAPHAQDGEPVPFQYDPRFAELHVDEAVPVPTSATEGAFSRLPERLRRSEGRTRWQQRFATEDQRLESVRGYYRLIAGIDEVIGRVRSALERRGLDERTIVVFSSDNGFLLGEHGLAGKWLPFEESIRIPLVIFDPRLPAARRGSVVDEMVLNIDLAPTLIALGGGSVPPGIQGSDLSPLLAGEASGWRTEWYYEHPFEHPAIPRSEALRTRRWKLVRYLGGETEIEQLFDLESDPTELVDLSGDERHSDRLAALRARLRQLRAAAR